MESGQGRDMMSRNCGIDTQVLIPSEQGCSIGGIPAVHVLPPGGGGGGSGGAGGTGPAPPRPCPPRWLLVGGLLLSLVLLTSVGVCFWQLYALQTRVQGLHDQLARCPCGGEAPGRAGKPDGEASTAAAQNAQTRRLLPTQRHKETVDKEDGMHNGTGGSDVGRKRQRPRRGTDIKIAPQIRRFVRKKLTAKFDKLEKKLETTKRELENSWHQELIHQENLTLHLSKAHLQAIHLYAYVNISDDDRKKLGGTNPPRIDVKTGNLTQYGLRPQQNSTAYTFWKIASWFKHCKLKNDLKSAFQFPCDSPGSMVSILKAGVYFIYVHITYQEDFVTAGFILVLSRVEKEDGLKKRTERHLVKCINSIRPQSVRDRMFRTCDVSTLQRLNVLDEIRIDKAYSHGNTVYIAGLGNNHMKPAETSFWGMVKISDDDGDDDN